MSTLSVCMIAKNEEEVIGRLLGCATGFADEIIVVDTGSTDKTKEIASKYTDKVFDFEWCDDFAAARNYSFDKATCDYCMWLDCDDIIDEKNQIKMKLMKRNLEQFGDCMTAAYRISADNVNHVVRIVRRGCCRWHGFIHEYLSYVGQRNEIDFEVVHSKPATSIARDSGRNLRIFEKKKSEGVPFETRDTLYYGKELYWNGRYDDALDVIDDYWKCQGRWYEDDVQIGIIEGDIWEHLGKLDKKVETLGWVIAQHGLNSRLLYNAGLAAYHLKKYNDAIFYFMPILLGLSWDSKYFIDTYEFKFHALIWTSCALWYNGNKEEGKRYHLMAKEMHPDDEIIINNSKFFE